MRFKYHTRIVGTSTIHIFNGFRPHDSQEIEQFQEFVRLHGVEAEWDWSMAGMTMTAVITDSRIATLFKMTF